MYVCICVDVWVSNVVIKYTGSLGNLKQYLSPLNCFIIAIPSLLGIQSAETRPNWQSFSESLAGPWSLGVLGLRLSLSLSQPALPRGSSSSGPPGCSLQGRGQESGPISISVFKSRGEGLLYLLWYFCNDSSFWLPSWFLWLHHITCQNPRILTSGWKEGSLRWPRG